MDFRLSQRHCLETFAYAAEVLFYAVAVAYVVAFVVKIVAIEEACSCYHCQALMSPAVVVEIDLVIVNEEEEIDVASFYSIGFVAVVV